MVDSKEGSPPQTSPGYGKFSFLHLSFNRRSGVPPGGGDVHREGEVAHRFVSFISLYVWGRFEIASNLLDYHLNFPRTIFSPGSVRCMHTGYTMNG